MYIIYKLYLINGIPRYLRGRELEFKGPRIDNFDEIKNK